MKKIANAELFKDILIVGILIIVYSIISFIHLGSMVNPQTFENIPTGSSAVFGLSETSEISFLRYFLGDKEGSYTVYGSRNNVDYTTLGNLNGYVLSWNDLQINSNYKYIKITSNGSGNLGEIQLYDENSNKINVSLISNIGNLLVDEPDTVPEIISYENSAYFDEIYFASSAHEYANGLPATEYTHPHLGKILQTIPVAIFGTTPFSYRLMGNIAGIAIVLVMYILGKMLFKNRLFAFLPAFLMAFDNMHFSQTRIGTVDGFLILFCLISSLFMLKYISLDREAPLKKKITNLFFCGFFFGLSVCVKWIAFYNGLGLAILFFGKMIYDSFKAKKFDKQNIIIILACIVFFIIIPCIIYISIYFVFETVYGKINNMDDFFRLTNDMFNFHSKLDADHPFSSKWYTWPIMLKPVWFYVANIGENITSTISNIGNPAIWWFGIVSMVYVLIAIIKGKKAVGTSLAKQGAHPRLMSLTFILVMFLAVLLPYVFIGRVMFLYHYFMAIPFLMLAITAFIKFLYEKFNKKWIVFGYLVLVFIMFWVFYPVSSGIPVPKTYVDSLKWVNTWYF